MDEVVQTTDVSSIEEIPNKLSIEEDDADGKRRLKRQDTSSYVAKKTAVQGLMDVALLSANANQLRYVIEYTTLNKSYMLILILISTSLVLQVMVGMSLILKGSFYYKGHRKRAQRLNDYVLVAMFLISTINVFIATFTQITPVVVPGGIRSKVTNSTTNSVINN